MDGLSGYIEAGGQQLHYLKWGNGSRLLLAFHGYGDAADVFDPMRGYLGTAYTVLSFDLPYHGGSKWLGNIKLEVKSITLLIAQVMREYAVEKVSLMGYSLGGRVCLAIIGQIPASIEKALLLAPDGMRIDPYFYFFTQTQAGKKMFRNMLEKPQPYINMIESMKKMKVLHLSRYKFAMHFMQTEESRMFLLKVWPAMSAIMPKPAEVRRIIKQYRIPVAIFMGMHDKIILPSIAKKFSAGLDTVQLHMLDKGHRVLDHETAQQIAAALL